MGQRRPSQAGCARRCSPWYLRCTARAAGLPAQPRSASKAGAVAEAARTGGWQLHRLDPRNDLVGDRPDTLDRECHEVAGLQRHPVLTAPAQLEQGTASARARAEHVAGSDPCATTCVCDKFFEAPRHVCERVVAQLAAIDARSEV